MHSFTFDDNSLLPALYGRGDEHLMLLEQNTDTRINYRGNYLEISGEIDNCNYVSLVLKNLYDRLKDGLEIETGEWDTAILLPVQKFQKKSAAYVYKDSASYY